MDATIIRHDDGTFTEVDADGNELGYGDWRDEADTYAVVTRLIDVNDASFSERTTDFSDPMATIEEVLNNAQGDSMRPDTIVMVYDARTREILGRFAGGKESAR